MSLFWLLENALILFLCGLLINRRAWRRHLAFFSYILFCAAANIVMFTIFTMEPGVYRSAYIVVTALGDLVMLWVAVALIVEVFFPLWVLPRGTVSLFLAAISAVIVCTVAWSFMSPPRLRIPSAPMLLTIDRATTLVLGSVFGFIAIFSSYFGLYWRQRTYGIGLGFLFHLGTESVRSVLATYSYSRLAVHRLDYFLIAAYMVTLLTWAWYFIRPDTACMALSSGELREIKTRFVEFTCARGDTDASR